MAEVALAVVLLAGAGLFISSFVRLMQIDLGLNPEHVLSVGVAPRSASARARALRRLAAAHPLIMAALERTQAVPGVVAASRVVERSSAVRQLDDVCRCSCRASRVGLHGRRRSVRAWRRRRRISTSCDRRLIRGRWIEAGDVAGSPPVVVLSDEAVRRYFGSRDPMDQIIILNEAPRTVVGIVRGVRLGGPESEVPPEAYIPFLQSDQTERRHRGSYRRRIRRVVAPHVQAAIRSVIPNAVVYEPQTIEQHFGTLVAQRKFNMIVLALFGSLAVVIASVGIYGLMAFLVAAAHREIGVRIALGAVPAAILQMVLGTRHAADGRRPGRRDSPAPPRSSARPGVPVRRARARSGRLRRRSRSSCCRPAWSRRSARPAAPPVSIPSRRFAPNKPAYLRPAASRPTLIVSG